MGVARPWKIRFWEKVAVPHGGVGCWEWTASVTGPGYGQFGVSHGNIKMAHRLAYELLVGPIPEGYDIDHLCRNRRCVNPRHLEAVDPRVNILRGVSPAAVNARKDHCNNGHPLAGDNLYICTRGKRNCRICRIAAQRRCAAKKRAAALGQRVAA